MSKSSTDNQKIKVRNSNKKCHKKNESHCDNTGNCSVIVKQMEFLENETKIKIPILGNNAKILCTSDIQANDEDLKKCYLCVKTCPWKSNRSLSLVYSYYDKCCKKNIVVNQVITKVPALGLDRYSQSAVPQSFAGNNTPLYLPINDLALAVNDSSNDNITKALPGNKEFGILYDGEYSLTGTVYAGFYNGVQTQYYSVLFLVVRSNNKDKIISSQSIIIHRSPGLDFSASVASNIKLKAGDTVRLQVQADISKINYTKGILSILRVK